MSLFKKSHQKKGIHITDPKIKKQLDERAADLERPKPSIAIGRDGELYLENAEHLTEEQVESLKKNALEKYQREQAEQKKHLAAQAKYEKEQRRLKKLGMEKVEGARKNHFIKEATEELENLKAEIKAAELWLKAHGYKKQVKDSIINQQPVKAGEWFKDYTPKLTDEENAARLKAYKIQTKNTEAIQRSRNIRALGLADDLTIPKI